MIRAYEIETNSEYLKDALINHSLTQQFSEILFRSFNIPYIDEPINFSVGVGKVIEIGLLRCEREPLPLIENGIISNFIDKVSKKILGIRYRINLFKDYLNALNKTSYITSTDLIIDFEDIGQHQVTIYGISPERHIALTSSQPQFIGIIFASVGRIFEPVYAVSLNDTTLMPRNFFPDKFISNLKKTNLFSKEQLRFISSDLESIVGNKYIFNCESSRALLRELNRLSLEKSGESK